VERVEVAPVGDRHRSLFGAACALGELVAGGELAHDEACVALERVGRLVGLSESDVRSAVRAGMHRGAERPRRAPESGHKIADRVDAILRVVAWFNAALDDPSFRGRRGATGLRILAGFAVKAIAAGKVEVAESYRELAEAAGVSAGTVAKHVPVLSAWVRRVRCGSVRTGRSVWRLRVARATGNNPTTSDQYASGLFPNARTLADPAHNYWYRWPSGWRLYHALWRSDGEASTSQLAALTGLHPGSVRRALKQLQADHLVVRTTPGQWMVLEGAPAPSEGLIDPAAARAARHGVDRQRVARYRESCTSRAGSSLRPSAPTNQGGTST
jgi:DNA-binding transcriptional ArsR family regulator